jgi:cytoskeletal protein CcmA (bactofilin family)
MADKDFVVKNGLIVNTNALVVDGSTNKVGVNTASPDATFSVVGTANVSGNVTFSSNLSVTGNTYINGRFEVNNNAYVEKKLYVGNTDSMIQDLPTIIQAVDNFNGFVMISSQNLSKLDDACADLITYADNTNGLSHFNDVGINNSRFDGTIHRISANTLSDTFVLGETLYQRNNSGANIAVGILRDRTVINATSRSLKISIQESDGLKTTLGAPQYTNTVSANLSLRGVTSGVNSDILVAVGFFESDGASGAYSRRNFPFTVGRRGDGYLYNANSALSIGTTGGGMRTNEQTISVSFSSGANQITLTSGNTDLMYAEMIVTGTGIPVDAYVTSIVNSTTFKLSKPTTAGSSGTYTAKDPYYDASGNPIIFHVGGMTANDEIARFVGNGNFVIGPNTTSRADKFTVAGTANITGNVAFGNNITVAGNTTVTGTVNASSVLVGANVVVNATTIQVGNTIANLVANSTLVKVSNSTSTANLTPSDLKIGSTTVVNSSQVTATLLVGNVSGSYANITGQVNTATLYAATSANIASAVQANSSGIFTTGSVNALSMNVGTAFTANSTVVNAVAYYSGTLLVANSTVSNATHLVGATWAAPSILGSSTANGASLTYANVSGRVNTGTLLVSTTANVGANVQLTTSQLFVGNTTVNSTYTSALLQVSNSTFTSNLSARDLTIGSTVVNSSQITATTLAGNLSGTLASVTGNISAVNFSSTSTAGSANVVTFGAANANFDSGTLFVDAVGNKVGIGTTTPDAALQVVGSANVSSNLTIGGGMVVATNASFDSGTLFVDAVNNRVGMGTTTPDAAL